jgi:hypothetical protein
VGLYNRDNIFPMRCRLFGLCRVWFSSSNFIGGVEGASYLLGEFHLPYGV